MAKSAIRFKDCEADFRRLSADIDARKYAPVYLLMGEDPYFIDALCEKLGDHRPRRGGTVVQPDNALRSRHRRRHGGELLPPGADDGQLRGNHRQGGAAARPARTARVLHRQAAEIDHTRNLPQGEERRPPPATLQDLRRERRRVRVGASARLRNQGLARGIRPLERVGNRPGRASNCS